MRFFSVAFLFSLSFGIAATHPTAEHEKNHNYEPVIEARGNYGSTSWEAAIKQGKELDCAMTHPVNTAASCFANGKAQITSEFTRFSELSTWGWEPKNLPLDDAVGAGSSDAPFYESLVPEKTAKYIKWIQERTVMVDKVEYEYTMGEYANIYDATTGTIVADSNTSPAYAAAFCDVKNLVKLQKWSDVTYLEWQNLCSKTGTSVKNLKYLVRSLIQNLPTAQIIAKALGQSSDFDEWEDYEDGVPFERGSDKFYALLGSPNGSGAAYLL